MSLVHLDFEKPIIELNEKIEALQSVKQTQDELTAINLDDEINHLKKKSELLTHAIFSDLGAWEIVQLARHPKLN